MKTTSKFFFSFNFNKSPFLSKTKNVILLLSLVFVLFSCNETKNSENTDNSKLISTLKPEFAKGFYVEKYEHYKKVFVLDPWDSTKILAKYILYPKNQKQIAEEGFFSVATPCNSMACLFSPEVAFAQKLGLIDNVSAISSIDYLTNPTLHQRVSEGKTLEIGQAEVYDLEKLLASNSDVCFVSPFKENKYQKIQESGMILAISATHMEEHPLARAEWIKFMALFFEKENLADSIFNAIKADYYEAVKLTENIKARPKILSGKMYQDVWYISGGKSYISQLFNDAGADYIWKDLPFSGSEPYDFETVLQKAHNADFWVFQEFFADEYSAQILLNENNKYAYFNAFKNKKIIVCNTEQTPYYEDGVIEPHLVLKDLIYAFHPALLPLYKPKYFMNIENQSAR